jgi:CDP-glucose 4,6-dehydratase
VEDVAVSSEFWRGRRVLITGHTGFKGGWLSLWLASRGAQVTGYSRGQLPGGSLYAAARVGELVASVDGDVCDAVRLEQVIGEQRPEVVIHLAAQPLVRTSYQAPLETYAANVIGTASLLEAARRGGGVRVVICVTSDKCYANDRSGRPHREDDPLGGDDPYSSSKACAELVARAYRMSFFSHEDGPLVASARAGNVIGGGDLAEDRIVPDAVRAAARGTTLLVRNPRAVRPWQHVLNPLSGYMLLAERLYDEPSLAGAWNFGPSDNDAREVGWVVERLRAHWGDGLAWRSSASSDDPPEAHALRIDSSKARELLGWQPPWALDEALGRTVEWFQTQRAGGDMRAVTLEQIEAFESAADRGRVGVGPG